MLFHSTPSLAIAIMPLPPCLRVMLITVGMIAVDFRTFQAAKGHES
jgi:hypothetical protein